MPSSAHIWLIGLGSVNPRQQMFRTGFLCRTGFFAGRGSLPDGVLCRTGFATRLQCFVNPRQQMFRTGFLCRTGFATPSAMFCQSSLPDGVCNPFCRTGFATPSAPQCFVNPLCLILLLPDGVCNPVRNVLSIPGSKCFFCRTGFATPSIPGSKCFGRGFSAGRGSLPDGVLCRTGFFAGRGSLPDGVCNPVCNVLSIPGSKCFGRGFSAGRGCNPRPAIKLKYFALRLILLCLGLICNGFFIRYAGGPFF